MTDPIKGREAIEALAQRFPQLYVAPAEGAQDAHRAASGRGVAPLGASLDHFITSPNDELREIDTPAGPVETLFLKERADFETFLQIIGNKSQPVPIARTIGAVTYRGLADWGAVAKERADYAAAGGDDWPAEFARLAKQPGKFRAEIIAISEGPYSNINASETPYDENEWLRISHEIRLHHECAHVVCRRTMPDDILPIWDEVTADMVGLLFAINRYDAELAAKFLGVASDGFTGGRLVEYLDGEQKERLPRIAVEVNASLLELEEITRSSQLSPFELLLDQKRKPLITY